MADNTILVKNVPGGVLQREYPASMIIDPGNVLEINWDAGQSRWEVTEGSAGDGKGLVVARGTYEDGLEGQYAAGDWVRAYILQPGEVAQVLVDGDTSAISINDPLRKVADGKLGLFEGPTSVTEESLTVAATVGNDSPHALANADVIPGTVFATIDGGVDLVEGYDYFVDYDQGQISFVSDGSLSGDETVLVDYDYEGTGGEIVAKALAASTTDDDLIRVRKV